MTPLNTRRPFTTLLLAQLPLIARVAQALGTAIGATTTLARSVGRNAARHKLLIAASQYGQLLAAALAAAAARLAQAQAGGVTLERRETARCCCACYAIISCRLPHRPQALLGPPPR
jgi:hypothetical protein